VVCARIGSAEGDILAKSLVSNIRALLLDFDRTFISDHSCGGGRTHPTDYNGAVSLHVVKFVRECARGGRVMWIVSNGNMDTIRLTLTSSGVREFFTVSADRIPLEKRAMFYEMIDGNGLFWRVLTPRCFANPARPGTAYPDCSVLNKVDMMRRAATVMDTVSFDGSGSTTPINPSEMLLIDDDPRNVIAVAQAGYQGLQISPRDSLAHALVWPDMPGDPVSDREAWLRKVFDRVERKKVDDATLNYQYWVIPE